MTQLLAGISINLAILLVKTYEFTGKLEDLGNALFEARIAATGAASEMSELDILLRHLWGLARMLHSGRALGTTQTIPCSHSQHAKPFALAFLILLPAIYGICPEAFLPTVAFLCGIGCNWAIDQWYRTGRAGGKPFHLGQFIERQTLRECLSVFRAVHLVPKLLGMPLGAGAAISRSDQPFEGPNSAKDPRADKQRKLLVQMYRVRASGSMMLWLRLQPVVAIG